MKQISADYKPIFSESKVPMLLISPDSGQIVDVNRAASDFYGYPIPQLRKKSINQINILSSEKVKQEMERAQRRRCNHFKFKHRLADGSIRDVEVYSSPVQLGQDRFLFSVVHDVTLRIAAEKRLNIYAQLFTASTDMLAVVDRNKAYLAANTAYLQTIGRSEEELLGRRIKDVVGKEMDALIDPYFRQALKGKPVVFERQLQLGEQQATDVEVRYFPFLDEDDKPAGVIGVLRDIAERKAVERKLIQSAKVFESTSEAVIITDTRGQFVDVNQAFEQVLGYRKSDVLGQVASQFFKDNINDFDEMSLGLQEKDDWRGEVECVRADGTAIPFWVTVSKVVDAKDKVINFVAVLRDISELKRSAAQLEYLAHYDPLTDVPNRILLQTTLTQRLNRARIHDHQLVVVLIDLDRFKSVNDSLGQPAGDHVLKSVAQRLKQVVRTEDVVARVSGDEFVVVLDNINDERGALSGAKKLREQFHKPFSVQNNSVFLTASIGSSRYPQDGEDTVELIRKADLAMYRAKEGGRNQLVFYSEDESQAKSHREGIIENELRGALLRNELSLNYQPQIDLRTGQICGLEVLCRWNSPKLGPISPAVFIPLAERLGLIWDIGSWVMAEACAQGVTWLDGGIDFGRLAINISGSQLSSLGFYEQVLSVLEQTGLPADCLELEITESFVMSHAAEGIQQLKMLREQGILIAIDDFGTGYSSLSYLKQLPISKLKIDRSFIDDVTDDEEDQVIASSIIALGNAMDLCVLAEGVECEPQLNFLERQGCDQVQGYLYSPPMSHVDVQSWLRDFKARQ